MALVNILDKFDRSLSISMFGHNNNLQYASIPLFFVGHYVGPFVIVLTVLVVSDSYLIVQQ